MIIILLSLHTYMSCLTPSKFSYMIHFLLFLFLCTFSRSKFIFQEERFSAKKLSGMTCDEQRVLIVKLLSASRRSKFYSRFTLHETILK